MKSRGDNAQARSPRWSLQSWARYPSSTTSLRLSGYVFCLCARARSRLARSQRLSGLDVTPLPPQGANLENFLLSLTHLPGNPFGMAWQRILDVSRRICLGWCLFRWFTATKWSFLFIDREHARHRIFLSRKSFIITFLIKVKFYKVTYIIKEIITL